jgi:hypothetical protein
MRIGLSPVGSPITAARPNGCPASANARAPDIELGFRQFPVVLVTLGQTGDALATGLEGLYHFVTVLAQAQGDLGLGEVALGGVEVLVHQLTAFPATFVAFLQQRVLAQGSEGFAADAEFDFSFFLHGRNIQNRERSRGNVWLPRPCSVQESNFLRPAAVYSARRMVL